MNRAIRADEVTAFRRDGAAPLRGLVSPRDVESLRAAVDDLMAQPSPRAKVASGAGVLDGPLAAAAAALMGAREVRFHHDHVLVKEGGTVTPTPWHQDQPYYDIDGAMTVSFWIPLDPVGRESTLEFLAGSHRGPWLMPRSFADREAKWFPEGSLGDLPDIEADRSRYPILGWAVEPGDAVAFHMLTLHAAAGSRRRRRVFSARFIGEDVRHAPRPWATSPEFPGLAEALPSGAPMDHPLFPVVWRA